MSSAKLLFLLSVSAALAAPMIFDSDSACPPAADYPVYWNMGEKDPSGVSLSQFQITTASATQTGGGCSNPNCKPWSQGVFPTIADDGTTVNGGVPQAANLSLHLAKIANEITSWIPDPDWNGNAVLDFEAWTTVWELNTSPSNWHGVRYQNLSKHLVQRNHPTWNSSQVEAEAKKQFETAATDFFVETLEMCRKWRPQAKWGFYGLPANVYYPCSTVEGVAKCGYDDPDQGPTFREYAQRQMPIWNASTALFPSIYIPSNTEKQPQDNAAYVSSTVTESLRLVSALHIPVIPFAWAYFHNGTVLLDKTDLTAVVEVPYSLGAEGVIFWGTSGEDADPTFLEYLSTEMGPLVNDFKTHSCACSASSCSSHGRCVGASTSTNTTCLCETGYSGSDCSHKQ